MRSYETVFITAPSTGLEALEKLVATFEEVISANGGELIKTINWGRRTLAYEIKKYREGIYTIFEFMGSGDTIKELERRLRLNDSVLKYLTVKTERKTKLIKKGTAKRQAKQEAVAKRRAARNPERGERA